MKKVFLLAAVLVFAVAVNGAYAFDNTKPVQPSQPGQVSVKATGPSSGAEWLAAEMPLQKWLGYSESERMKVARGFADDYYQMDKGCSYAKIKAFYDEKREMASIYVECTERSAPKTNMEKSSHLGT